MQYSLATVLLSAVSVTRGKFGLKILNGKAILCNMMKSCGGPLCHAGDVIHPFVQHICAADTTYLFVNHSVANSVIR